MLGSGPGAAAGQPAWQRLGTVEGTLPPRAQHGLAVGHDDVVHVFGGADATGRPLDDLWRLAPTAPGWEQVVPRGAYRPPPLVEPHLVADVNGDLYEFGGLFATGRVSNQLFRFDAASQSWVDLRRTTWEAGVPAREDHGVALDPQHRDIYVFGGLGESGLLNDFWRYNIEQNTWEDLTRSSGSDRISPRELYNITYDYHGRLYLFGGTNQFGTLNDFWRYDIQRGSWEELTDRTGARDVPGRHYYGQACDADGNFYILGGIRGIAPIMDDFWIYRTVTRRWSRLDPAEVGSSLLPRIPYVLGFQRGLGRLITTGGSAGGRLVGDTWVLDMPVVRQRLLLPGPAA
jgi:hypothetical protein